MLNEIIEQQKRMTGKIDQLSAQTKLIVKVPTSMIGLVIGKNGESLI